MQKQSELISAGNHYSYSNLMKATAIFVTTVSSYGFFTSLCLLTNGIKMVQGGRAGPPPIGISSESLVNTWTTDGQGSPAIAGLPSGDFVVVWTSDAQDGWRYGVYGQRYAANGVSLGTEFRVNTWTTGFQDSQSITGLTTGGFVVVWSGEAQSDSRGIYAQRYAGNGTALDTEFRVNTWTTSNQDYPSITGLSSGDFVVVWSSRYQDGSVYGVYGQRYTADGMILGSEFRVNTWTTDDQWIPAITGLPNGNFVVVWTSGYYNSSSPYQDGSGWGVYGQHYAGNGTALGSEFRVNTWTTGNQGGPSITGLSSGDFVVVWESGFFCGRTCQDGSGRGVYAQRYAANGSSLGSEFLVNTWTTGDQGSPSITSLFSGDFVVVWTSICGINTTCAQDGSGSGVYGQRYAANGSTLGTEFRINSWTTDDQGSPSITGLSSGDFVVVWESSCRINMTCGQDGSYSGVYGRLCTIPYLLKKTLTVQEGQIVIVTPIEINSIAVSAFPKDLIYNVTQVQHGRFEWVNSTTVITTFTQQHINDGVIQFRHDGSELAPSFTLLVSVGPINEGPYNATIIYTPVNDPPILQMNQMRILQGQTIILTELNLQATDIDSDIMQLQFLISNLQHGYFSLIATLNSSITNFTQQQIKNGQIRFTHDRSTTAPSYDVTASDGIGMVGPYPANITFILVNQSPVLTTYQFSISKGGKITLTSAELSAYDVDSNNATLTFQLSNIQQGRFEFGSNPGVSITLFTQQQIWQGNVKFIHDGSDIKPTASVIVTDGTLFSSPSPVLIAISFNSFNGNGSLIAPGENTNTDLTGAIVGGVVGGAIVLGGLIGLTVWGRKRAQDAATRKQHRFADHLRGSLKLEGVDNFESEKGQRYLAVVKKLENAFASQGGIILRQMDDDELKNLAKQVAASSRNKITSSTALFGYSIIRPEDFGDRKISDIVQDVCMRVGKNNRPIPFDTESSRKNSSDQTSDQMRLLDRNEIEMGSMKGHQQPLLAGYQ